VTEMVSVAAARALARKRVDRDMRDWAVHGGHLVEFDIALKPPTERVALADLSKAAAWTASWRSVSGAQWAVRNWPSIGRQETPERLILRGADAIARFAGMLKEWQLLAARAEGLLTRFGTTDVMRSAIRSHAREILELTEVDLERLDGVVQWLGENSSDGWLIRQLSIRGVDTKWVSRHRGLVSDLSRAVTGRGSMDLIPTPTLVRVRFLDTALRPGGLTDVTAPVDELAQLAQRPATVLIVENLETLLALPDIASTVAVHGSGYGVADRLRNIPWLSATHVLYWGDLDSHGFAILNELRSHLQAESMLMDEETLLAHRDLWVPEPKPAVGTYPLLSSDEERVLARLRTEGSPRLEQERIPWEFAMQRVLPRCVINSSGTSSPDWL